MSRSTKLASAAHILTFVASRAPDQVTTDTIAKAIDDHPARVRQIVAGLVKASFLNSIRGASGGVVLARSLKEINLRQLFEAVEDQPIISLSLKDDFKDCNAKCRVRSRFERLYREMEEQALKRMEQQKLDTMTAR